MKLNLKAIAAAAVLAASGSSFAQIANNTAPNPELYVAAFDFGAQVGFVIDTNVGWNSLTSGFNFSYDLDNSAAWNSFTSAAQANAASTGIQWGTFSSKFGTDQGFLLGNNAETTSPVISAANAGSVRTLINNVNNLANSLGNSDAGVFVNGPQVAASITPDGNFSTRLSWDATEVYGAGAPSIQNLFKYTIARDQTNLFVGTTSIGAGNLLTVASVSPIPEPGSYALMLAGLFAVGVVVHRRSNR